MYEITQLFLYKILFMFELLSAMHLSFMHQPKRKYYPLRIVICALICLGIASAYPVASYSSWYSSIMFFLLFLIASFSMYFIYDTSWKLIVFLSVSAYTLQHVSHELYALIEYSFSLVSNATLGMYGNQAIDFANLQPKDFFNGLIYVDAYLLAYALFYFGFTKKMANKKIEVTKMSILYLSGLLLAIDIVLNAIVVYIPGDYSRVYSIVASIYNMISCFMVFYIQSSVINTKELQKELKTTEQLLHISQEQYKESKQNIELINLKCHDLKHQIRQFGEQGKLPTSTIKDMEKVICIYDSTVHTGNEALDVTLTEKSLYCNKSEIRLTSLADCSKLGFIEESDLYSLFGNAIDNAIEAVSKLADKSKRNINLKVRNINSFVSIVVENYFSGSIILNNENLPVTTKQDKDYHGFGISSIKFITDKYHGDLKIETNKDIFTLSILIPIPTEKKNLNEG